MGPTPDREKVVRELDGHAVEVRVEKGRPSDAKAQPRGKGTIRAGRIRSGAVARVGGNAAMLLDHIDSLTR